EPRHVHLPQFDRSRRGGATPLRARQHRRALVDRDHLRPGRIEREIPARADRHLEDATGKTAKYLRPDLAIAPVLARQLEQIVSPREPVIDEFFGRRHLPGSGACYALRSLSSRPASRALPPAGGLHCTCTTSAPTALRSVANSSRPTLTTRGGAARRLSG